MFRSNAFSRLHLRLLVVEVTACTCKAESAYQVQPKDYMHASMQAEPNDRTFALHSHMCKWFKHAVLLSIGTTLLDQAGLLSCTRRAWLPSK